MEAHLGVDGCIVLNWSLDLEVRAAGLGQRNRLLHLLDLRTGIKWQEDRAGSQCTPKTLAGS